MRTQNFGWTTICKKQQQKKTQKTNFIKRTFSLSNCKSVYKCNACGCVRKCVIGKVVPASSYYREIFFQHGHLKKAQGRRLFVPLRYSFHFSVECGISTFTSKDPFYSKSQRSGTFVQIIHSKT